MNGARVASAGAVGTLFGAGLALSGMTNPAKVQNFLDPFGAWDPTLALVMGGALAVAVVAFRLAARRSHPWLAESFAMPTRTDLDISLVAGAILFGAGWGLVGLCPGPAIASLLRGSSEVWLFVGSMVGSVFAYRWLTHAALSASRASSSDTGI